MKQIATHIGGGTQHSVVGHLSCPFCESLNLDVHEPCIADFQRVVEWAKSKNRKPAQLAFTAGPERQAAYWIEWAEINMPNPTGLGTTHKAEGENNGQ